MQLITALNAKGNEAGFLDTKALLNGQKVLVSVENITEVSKEDLQLLEGALRDPCVTKQILNGCARMGTVSLCIQRDPVKFIDACVTSNSKGQFLLYIKPN